VGSGGGLNVLEKRECYVASVKNCTPDHSSYMLVTVLSTLPLADLKIIQKYVSVT